MRVIQIGVGSFGRSWATLVRHTEGIELAAVVEPFAPARVWAGQERGLAASDCLASLDEALARDDWEAALVVSPPETHRAVTERVLRAGRHVLVEKPLATTL